MFFFLKLVRKCILKKIKSCIQTLLHFYNSSEFKKNKKEEEEKPYVAVIKYK